MEESPKSVTIEPGAYIGKKDGKLVVLFVYGEHPFLRVDMVECEGRKDVALNNLINNIDPSKWNIEFVSKIELPKEG